MLGGTRRILAERSSEHSASLYAFLVPPFGVLLVSLVRWQPPSASHPVGVVVVLAGLALLRPGRTEPEA